MGLALHIAGIMTSAILLGAVLGALGDAIGHLEQSLAALVISAVGLMLAGRDIGVLRIPIPQLRRQTQKTWRHSFGSLTSAWLWGLDLGSGLTTLVNYAVYWILPLAAILRGEVVYGSVVLGLFGVGRAFVTAAVSLAFRADPNFEPRDLLGLQSRGVEVRRMHSACAAALMMFVGGCALGGRY